MNATFERPEMRLLREHRSATPRIQKIAAMGHRLLAGRTLDPREIARAVEELDERFHRQHANRFDGPLRFMAREVASPRCVTYIDRVRHGHAEVREIAELVRDALERYRRSPASTRHELGALLQELAFRDLGLISFEETHPLACLREALPESLARRVAEEFARETGALPA